MKDTVIRSLVAWTCAVRKNTCTFYYLILPVLLFGLPAVVLAQTLPSEVQPGGVLPGIEQTAPEIPSAEPTPVIPAPTQIELLPLDESQTFNLDKVELAGVAARGEDIKPDEVQRLVDLEMQEANGEWSVNRLNRLANKITNYYRQRDYFLTRAMVLEQALDSGTAEITVVEGVLGNVIVQGAEHIKPEKIQQVFDGVRGESSTREDLESALFYASDFAGIAGRGVLRRGEEPGTADIEYVLSRDKRYEFYLHADNYGSEFVGEHRLRADVAINNPTGEGDRLTLSALHSLDPANNRYAGFDYTFPLIMDNGKPLNLGISGSYNEFEVGGALEQFGIEGSSDRFDVYLGFPYRRGVYANSSASLALSSKSSETRRNDLRTSLDELTILTARHLWQRSYLKAGGGSVSINLGYSKGFDDKLGSMPENAPESSRLGASGTKAGGNFSKYNWSVNWAHRIAPRWSLRSRINGQQSNDLLVSLEQFPIGGPNSVRAYSLSSFLTDSGLFASLELGFQVRSGLSISAYADYAEGDLNEPLPADVAEVDVRGVGLGINLNLRGKYSLAATYAKPTGDIPDGFSDDSQFFVSLSAAFK